MQFGTNSDFEKALRIGETKNDYPCHILKKDMDVVIAAIKELTEELNRI